MSTRNIAAAVAVTFLVGTVAFAQSQSRNRSSAAAVPENTESTMTVVGCLIKEADYRRAHKLGKGALGGVGLGDEFVLVNATVVPATASSSSATGEPARSTASASSERCSEAGTGQAYRVTGKSEDELKPFVGRRMVITGRFDHERDARTAAGQTNAKLPAEIRIASYAPAPAAGAPASANAAPPAPNAAEPTPPPASTQSPVASNEPPAQRLPNTASKEPLVALIGLLCAAGFIAIHRFRVGTF